MAVILGFSLLVVPWLIRNHTITGRAELSTIQSRNLLFYNVSQMRASQQGISHQAARAQLEEEVQEEISDAVRQDKAKLMAYYQRKALDEIRAHWFDYAQVHLKGSSLYFVVPTSGTVARALGWVRTGTGLLSNLMVRGLTDSWQAFRNFHRRLTQSSVEDLLFFGVAGYELLFLSILNFSALLGVVSCLRQRNWGVLLFAVPIIGYFALTTGPVSYDARYRIPILPFLALLAAFGMQKVSVK